MDYDQPTFVLHWNYRGFTEFPIQRLEGDESEVTDIYLKENLISQIPADIGKLVHLESLYLSGNDITELPKEISTLKFLKCLDLSGNRLRSLPEDIGDVRRLKFLILDENELTELPLRIAELRSLRYLSVCDNKLKWLPQRPVYNYHHCELRFWRNTNLTALPFSLWYHMFRGQQTRSLNIGCLKIPGHKNSTTYGYHGRCRLKLSNDSTEWEYEIEVPHRTIYKECSSPPSLYEICKRKLYQLLTNTSKKLSTEMFSIYSEDRNKMPLLRNLEDDLKFTNTDNGNAYDLNGNNLTNEHVKDCYNNNQRIKRETKEFYAPKNILEDYISFLPDIIKEDLCNGPVSRCENVSCKMPIFDYAFYEFCIGNIILIDNTEEVILSAAFCSKFCAETWKKGRLNLLIPWTLLEI